MTGERPDSPAAPRQPPGDGPELLEDGQEEVFSKTAVEHGVVKDPPAMGPVDDCEPDAP